MRKQIFSAFIFVVILEMGNAISFTQEAAFLVSKQAFQQDTGEKGSPLNLLQSDRFRPYQSGYDQREGGFVCVNQDMKSSRGVSQHVELNQTIPFPLFASAESRAENVAGSTDADYSVYLDLQYADGSHDWGKSVPFDVGTHDWQRKEVAFYPEKPVKSLSYYTLFRNHSGKAEFRNLQLKTIHLEKGVVLFDGVPVIPNEIPEGTPTIQIRDVAAKSDFFCLPPKIENESKNKTSRSLDAGGSGLNLNVTQKNISDSVAEITLNDLSGKDRAITLVYSVGIPRQNSPQQRLNNLEAKNNIVKNGVNQNEVGKAGQEKLLYCEHPRLSVPVEPNREYCTARSFRIGSSGRLSRYPFAAVVQQDRGWGIGIDLATPAFFRTAYHDATGELYVACDIGLTPEKPTATVRFCRFSFDGKREFRGALAEYYKLFPDAFVCRTPKQGIWMPFGKISSVENWSDFGFQFKEGDDETDWDDQNGITTFRYTEPMTWWMSMKPDGVKTSYAAWEEAKRLARQGNPQAIAFLGSGYHDENGKPIAKILDTPWCNGAVWSMNDAPGISGANGFARKWNPELFRKLYGPEKKNDLDGEYIDSSEGYVTGELDFRRDHFAAMQTPLTFSSAGKPAIFRGLIAFEYIRGIEKDLRPAGKLLMANATPDHLCWLAPLLDVLGTETDWNYGGKWSPMSDTELMYRRVLCGPKPFCFLMNTDFDNMSHEFVQQYMKRCLAYGMFPGFFSANAATKTYFSQPAFYNRDRDLFKKYVPLVQMVAQAGWQPITYAACDDSQIVVERFGDTFWTVLNDSPESKTVRVSFEWDQLQHVSAQCITTVLRTKNGPRGFLSEATKAPKPRGLSLTLQSNFFAESNNPKDRESFQEDQRPTGAGQYTGSGSSCCVPMQWVLFEHVNQKKIECKNGVATFPLGPGDVAVLGLEGMK